MGWLHDDAFRLEHDAPAQDEIARKFSAHLTRDCAAKTEFTKQTSLLHCIFKLKCTINVNVASVDLMLSFELLHCNYNNQLFHTARNKNSNEKQRSPKGVD